MRSTSMRSLTPRDIIGVLVLALVVVFIGVLVFSGTGGASDAVLAEWEATCAFAEPESPAQERRCLALAERLAGD